MAFGQYPTYYPSYASQMPPYTPMQVPQPMMTSNPMQTQTQPQQPATGAGNGLLWVASRQEAQVYPVAPGGVVTLWDANGPYVYLRQADASGKPGFSGYKLIPLEEEPAGDYVTREEFNKLVESLTRKKEVAADD